MHIVLQILYTVIILGVLIFIHEFGHFIVAKACGIRVNEFALGMGPRILKKQGKETLYSLRLFPVGGFCAMEGEDEESDDTGSFTSKPAWKRFLVVIAGAAMNLILGFIITLIIVSFSEALPSCTVGGFSENSLSEQSGLQIDDTIIAINGSKVSVYTDISTRFSLEYNKDTADITVLRNGQEVVLEGVRFPTEEVADGMSCMMVDFLVYREAKTFGNIMKQSFRRTLSFITMMYDTLRDLITGSLSVKYISGPVGVSSTISEAASYGFMTVLYLVALLSINLAVMNLLPLPALDGGRAVLIVFEMIFRKKVPVKVEAIINFAGLAILLALMVLITVKDIFFPVV